MEMDMDSPDLPTGMLSDIHLKRGEKALLEFVEAVKSAKGSGRKEEGVWSDHSQRWFTLMPSTRPFIFKDHKQLADIAAAGCETVRDINVASRLIGDMSGATLDDPLSDRYKKLGCFISALDKESDDYKMIVKYLETTYEPVKVADIVSRAICAFLYCLDICCCMNLIAWAYLIQEYGIRVEDIFAVEWSVSPSLEDVKTLPNKVLLWCGESPMHFFLKLSKLNIAIQLHCIIISSIPGSRSSNLLRHLQKGFLPAVCSLPAPGYMSRRAIVCSDAAAEAARYGFTAVYRPEGFLVLAVASLGHQIVHLRIPKLWKRRKLGSRV
ncbi:unnamed protein product [Linum trigynum]|uniref:Poly [ADP-ribose] polymerase n=1 Tax=Linum trigynum TaxID=586398 RepID=A0AAV2D4F9_9ROSI